jgi:hypothetical protein
MVHGLQKAAWVAVYMLSMVAVISATRATRHCLIHHGHSGIEVGVIHRVGIPFFGLKFCETTDTVSLRPSAF